MKQRALKRGLGSSRRKAGTDTRILSTISKSGADIEVEEVVMVDDTEEETPSVTDDDHGVSLEGEQSEEVDDEIEIIKADIYKYHGEKTYSQEVRDDVFKFQYFDDFEEDVEILEDDEEEEDEGSIGEGDVGNQLEEPKPLLKCEECDDLLAEDDLEGHVTVNHPVLERKEIKQFGGGNFLMLA